MNKDITEEVAKSDINSAGDSVANCKADYMVEIVCEGDDLAKWSTTINVEHEKARLQNILKLVVEHVLHLFGVASSGQKLSVCVMLSNNKAVQEYNNQFRGKNTATNVLSFSMWGFNLANGDKALPEDDFCGVDEDLIAEFNQDINADTNTALDDSDEALIGGSYNVGDEYGDDEGGRDEYGDDEDDSEEDGSDEGDGEFEGEGEFIHVGDVIFAYETVASEAKEFEKSAVNHVTHLFVHSVLHLFGLDHIGDEERLEMEQIEIDILRKLSIGNPYEV